MSHSILITVSLPEYEKNKISTICEEAIQKIQSINIFENKGVENYINLKIEELKKIEREKENQFQVIIAENQDKDIEYGIQLFKDNLIKNITNFVSSISNKNLYSAFEYTNKIDYDKWIEKYGSLVWEAITILKSKNQTANDNNLGEIIDEILNKKANNEFKDQMVLEIQKNIEEIFINNHDLKFHFKNILNHLETYQELSDYNIFINSKKITYQKMKELEKKVFIGLKKIRGYCIDQTKRIERKINQQNKIYFVFHLKNKLNETFDLVIDEELKLNYKIGDYKDHCCEATSQKLWMFLEQNGIKIKQKQITREFGNAKPLYKSISKIKEKEKK